MKKLLVGLCLTLSLSAFASTIDELIGSHQGVEMSTEENCEVSIAKKNSKNVAVSLTVGDETVSFPLIKESKFNKILAGHGIFSFRNNLTLGLYEDGQLSFGLNDQGKLNYVTIIKSTSKRGCTYNCETHRAQIICGYIKNK